MRAWVSDNEGCWANPVNHTLLMCCSSQKYEALKQRKMYVAYTDMCRYNLVYFPCN